MDKGCCIFFGIVEGSFYFNIVLLLGVSDDFKLVIGGKEILFLKLMILWFW